MSPANILIRHVFIFLVIVLFFMWSCYYDNEEYLYPLLENNCDTTNVTFSSSVKPILEQHCFSCHSNSTAAFFGDNIKLEDYTDAKLRADEGSLYGAVAHLGSYSPMPKGAQKIGDCKISVIRIWADAGAPNN